MPKRHKCRDHWGGPASRLLKLLEARTEEEREAVRCGIGRRARKPYEGWVHRVKSRTDYNLLKTLFFELCLAIKQPTDMPTHWGKTEVGGEKRTVINAGAMGRLARATLKGLEKDGNDRAGRKVPVHTEHEIPRYGTPNWLEKPPGQRNFESVQLARSLLSGLRAAMAR